VSAGESGTLDQQDTTIRQRMIEASDLITVALDQLLPRADGPESRLIEAMRYAVLGPGRRIRPYFTLETARMLDVDERSVLRAACALECVHAYSLIHDDLPALDDDDVRGGRPTVHRAYDEGAAVLAGDALQSIAFEILAHGDTHPDAQVRCELVRKLAAAAGAKGLAGGQMLDLLGLGADLRTVARMQRMKTGALIAFAVEAPLILARAATDAQRHALLGFANDFGLAYQIVDDLADEARDLRPRKRSGIGAAGSEAPAAKANFVTLLGRDGAGERLALLASQCSAHLDMFGPAAAYLRASADFVLDRRA
jgi:farnesyl diphosphate synthase